MTVELELKQAVELLKARGYQVQGLLFWDPKLKLLGICPVAGVPDAWTEAIGKRLAGIKGAVSWTEAT